MLNEESSISLILELIAIGFQITGFIFLLPNFDKARWDRFSAGHTTKKSDKIINWIANYGPKLGVYIILLGFVIQIVNLFL